MQRGLIQTILVDHDKKKHSILLQEIEILDSISDYFKHTITEVPYDEEEKFEEVLIEAGLTRGMDAWTAMRVKLSLESLEQAIESIALRL